MNRTALDDAFGHHIWATRRLLETCAHLTPEQLDTTVPGTYGSIIATLRHAIGGGDTWYQFRIGGDAYHPLTDEEEAALDIDGLLALWDRVDRGWADILATKPDPDEMVQVRRDDGSETHAPKGIRLAQVIHHGTDHRSQICTALTQLGVEPPEIDVWAYGVASGRITEVAPTVGA